MEVGSVIVEHVTYRSGPLLVHGQVCRPSGDGPYPLVVYGHGGWMGLGADWNGGSCLQIAQNLGWVVIEPSYRGEDESEGEVEICLGEVDDLLAMKALGLEQPYVDADRVAMIGGSHGGCITLRALERGAAPALAVVIAPATDWAALHATWSAALEAGVGTAEQQAFWTMSRTAIEGVTGGSPATAAEAYRVRSPLGFAEELDDFEGPLLVTSGAIDDVTPPPQQCGLAAAGEGFHAYHVVDGEGTLTDAVPAGCEDMDLTWAAEPDPRPTWAERRYLVVYDTVGHYPEDDNPVANRLLFDLGGFLLARMP